MPWLTVQVFKIWDLLFHLAWCPRSSIWGANWSKLTSRSNRLICFSSSIKSTDQQETRRGANCVRFPAGSTDHPLVQQHHLPEYLFLHQEQVIKACCWVQAWHSLTTFLATNGNSLTKPEPFGSDVKIPCKILKWCVTDFKTLRICLVKRQSGTQSFSGGANSCLTLGLMSQVVLEMSQVVLVR